MSYMVEKNKPCKAYKVSYKGTGKNLYVSHMSYMVHKKLTM